MWRITKNRDENNYLGKLKKKTIIQHLALKSNHTLHLIDENKTLRVMKVLSYEIVSNKIIINSTAS